ncbi:MAG: hypothetical protein WCL46_06205, partial [Chlorobium sp.]
MVIPLISYITKRNYRNRLRACIRGYRLLTDKHEIGLFRKIRFSLSDTVFSGMSFSISRYIFGSAYSQAEILIRQYVLTRQAQFDLNNALLYSLGKNNAAVIFPLPNEWIRVLHGYGINISRFKSLILWGWIIFMHVGYGVYCISKIAVKTFINTLTKRYSAYGKYAYLSGLSLGNIPHNNQKFKSYDICSFYSQWSGRLHDNCDIRHSVIQRDSVNIKDIAVQYIDPPYLLMYGYRQVGSFLTWGVKAVIISIIDALKGRWWHAYMLAEAAQAKAVQL